MLFFLILLLLVGISMGKLRLWVIADLHQNDELEWPGLHAVHPRNINSTVLAHPGVLDESPDPALMAKLLRHKGELDRFDSIILNLRRELHQRSSERHRSLCLLLSHPWSN